ncbi:MAG: SPFH domain-containing protein, partial [Patescibacteria group bacterium]
MENSNRLANFLIIGALGIVLTIVVTFSSCTKVPPGYVGIRVNQYGTQRGVEDFPIHTGRVWYNPLTQDVYQFPTFLQNVVWNNDPNEGNADDESITFNSVEGAVVNADIALSYGFTAEKVPNLFVEFRRDPEHITQVYMRSQVRDTFSRIASTMKVTEIFGAKKQELEAQHPV